MKSNHVTIRLCVSMGIALAMSFSSMSRAETAQIWNAFMDAKAQSQRLPIPDFSYAGYARGEKAIPSPDWPVFDVTEYGAIADDANGDLDAVKAAIAAAEKSGKGIVFFPKGRYLLSENKNIFDSLIRIKGSHIILRGEGEAEGATELVFREHLNSTTPNKKWTTPPMLRIEGSSSSFRGNLVTTIVTSAQLGSFRLEVKNATTLKENDFIIINLLDPAAANDQALAPYTVEDAMTTFKKGEFAREYHQIDKIDGSVITLKEPLHMDIDAQYNWEVRKTNLGKQFGIEDIAFVGAWKDTFVHHKDIIHDSGWTAIQFGKYYNSWFKNVRFKDWNSTLNIASSLAISAINISLEGNRGHSGVHVSNSYGVLLTHSHSTGQGQFHEQGVSGQAAGTVFHRNTWPKETSFDAHATFPHATLFDRIDGGFSGASGGGGGSASHQPNHMRDLVFWNFKDLGQKSNIESVWWRKTKYRRYLLPKIVGWHGALPRFPAEQLGLNESFGDMIEPESLYEAQLELRLGKVPDWLNALKGTLDTENQEPTIDFHPLQATYPFGSSLQPVVNAKDTDGRITNVALFLNGEFIRDEVDSPYEWGHLADKDALLKNLTSGQYVLKAVATDDRGASASVEHAFTVEKEIDVTTILAVNDALLSRKFVATETPEVVLSFTLNSSSDAAKLEQLSISTTGDIDRVNDISSVGVFHDVNRNGKAESEEEIGSGVYNDDSSELLLSIDGTLALREGDTPILITYEFQ